MSSKTKKYLGCILLFLILVFIDRSTKNWAVEVLKNGTDLVLWKGVFELHYLENTGMAFGLFKDQQMFFYIMTAVIMAFVIFAFVRTPANKRFSPVLILMTMISAGAIGNLIDRITTKYVVDFLYFSLIDFPVFNAADCFITVGCILLMICFIAVYKDEELSVYNIGKKKDGTL